MASTFRLSPIARSLFAVIDGLLLFLALDALFYLVAFFGLHRSSAAPSTPYLTFHLIWALIAALLGGYTAARVAHRAPVIHGLITAIPVVLLSLYRLSTGPANRRTPFALAYDLLVPLAFIAGAYLYSQRRPAGRKAGLS